MNVDDGDPNVPHSADAGIVDAVPTGPAPGFVEELTTVVCFLLAVLALVCDLWSSR